ncbi:MAG: DUF1302 family protein [Rubricoccaceae bacterium]|nr:DUF1302 family protein [Rubricoccaceae bacterium]
MASALLAGLLGLLPPAASAQPALTGYAEPYVAVQAGGDGAVLAGRTRARLDVTAPFDRGALAIRNEVTYDLLADSLDVVLREATLDVYGLVGGRVDLRAGHQILVWGETDGAFITDLLAPLDLTEFLAQPQERLRLAVTAAQAAAYLGDVVVEAVWVPVSPTSRLPAAGSPWDPAPTSLVPLQGPPIPVVRTPHDRPDARLASSEGAVRLTWSGLPLTDLALLAHTGTGRVPGFAVRPTLSLLEGLRIEVTPTYRRRVAVGATVETAALDPFVLRGEAAYETATLVPEHLPDSPLDLLDPALEASVERGFVLERPQVQAAVTAERLFSGHLVRLTALGRWVLDADEQVAAEAFQPSLVGVWTRSFRRETLTARALLFWTLGEGLWASPSLTYALRDALNLEVGAQVFEGLGEAAEPLVPGLSASPNSLFALYDANDLVYARLRYSF